MIQTTKIRCPFCSFSLVHTISDHSNVLRCADRLRYHLEYECAIHNVKYVEDYV